MSTDKKIFVHNRVGLMSTLNCMRTSARPTAPQRIPSPIDTDTDEDNGYKSLETTGRSGSTDSCLPQVSSRLSSSDVFMPPPSTPSVIKKHKGSSKFTATANTPMSKSCTKQWVTSTPNVESQHQRKNCKKAKNSRISTQENKNVSLNWESEDEGRFSQQSTNTDNGCDHELCECQPQMNFSFAVNCDDADSLVHSTFSGDEADSESLGSKDDLSFDDDEKVLSGDRLSQMTRTYHDIEAVTHLLEEKERDLELAARIGQTLLQKNREIVQKNEVLEEQLAGALEEVSQLRHEISLKEDLLHTYADDDTDSSGAPSPVKELRNFGRAGMYNHIEGLQVKIRKLEAESNKLKNEQAKFETENEALESEEQQLVSDTVKELNALRDELRESRENNRQLTEELSQRNEEAVRQQEEITRLLTQIVDMQRKQKQLALENEELQQHLTAANNTQYELTREVQELGERYQEVTNMLDETREEARLLRDYPEQYGTSVPFSDSLAAELECSGGMSAELQFQDSQSLSFYNPSQGSINWSSPPSSVIDEETGVENLGPDFHTIGKTLRGVRSEPRPRGGRNDTLSQRVLNTARFVNNVKNFSMNSKFQYATPKKQDRPIPTPLPIPGSNRSPRFIHASPDSTPSSGRCMSSTPHDKHRASSRSSFHNYTRSIHGFVTPLKNASPLVASTSNCSNRPTSLRLQLANRKLAQQSVVVSKDTSSDSHPYTTASVHALTSLSRLNRSMSAMPSREEIPNKRAERSWHGESLETFEGNSNKGFTTPSLGRPGIPGTEDLERAIRKLALRRESARYMEMDRRSAMNDESFNALCGSGTITPGSSLPSGGRTPPPSCPGSPKPSRKYRFGTRSTLTPKLRIVKPLEGSVTLNQWKYLAERDRLLSTLQLQSEMPSGIMTRERVAEVLSRSKDNSLTNTSESDSKISILSSPIIDKSLRSCVETTTVTNSRPIPNASSSPTSETLRRRSSVSESEQNATAPPPTKAPQISPICPGKGFASTSTRYTFINSRVMNPSDDAKTVPSCSTMTQTSTYCNSQMSMLVSTSSSDQVKKSDNRAYLSHIHPFLTGQSKHQDKEKQAEVAKRFFFENTRTCSMQLGLAHLFKEHAVQGLPNPQESVADTSVFTEPEKQDPDLDSPPLIGSGPNSAFTAKTSKPQTSHGSSGHIVWNRNLQRTFLLPSLPTKNIFFNINRRSDPKKPETPPNSPLTSTPSSSSFLLNDIISEVTQTSVETSTEQKQEGIFSSNLLSKLAQIGFMGMQGFRSVQTSAVDRTQVATSSTNTYSTVCSTHSSSTRASISKCATAPGCLQSKGASLSASRTSLDDKTADQADKGLQMDMAQLHGSSGALNVTDGYLDEVSDEDCAQASSGRLPKVKEDLVTDVGRSSRRDTKSKTRSTRKTATPKAPRSKSRSGKK